MITLSVASQNPTVTSATAAGNQLTIRRETTVTFNIVSNTAGIVNAILDNPANLPAGLSFAYISGGTATISGTCSDFASLKSITVRFKNSVPADVDSLTFTIQVLDSFSADLNGNKLPLTNWTNTPMPYTIQYLDPLANTYSVVSSGTVTYPTIDNTNVLDDGVYLLTIDNTVIPFYVIYKINNGQTNLYKTVSKQANEFQTREQIDYSLVFASINTLYQKIHNILLLRTAADLQLTAVTSYIASVQIQLNQIAYFIAKCADILGCYTDADYTPSTVTIVKYPLTSDNDCGC